MKRVVRRLERTRLVCDRNFYLVCQKGGLETVVQRAITAMDKKVSILDRKVTVVVGNFGSKELR